METERCVKDVNNQKLKNLKGCKKEVLCYGTKDFKRVLNLGKEEERKFVVDDGSDKMKELRKSLEIVENRKDSEGMELKELKEKDGKKKEAMRLIEMNQKAFYVIVGRI